MINDLTQFPITVKFPLHWGEMDSFGHINNVIYFRYFESARIAYLDRIKYKDLSKDLGIGIILASVQAKFIVPLFYPDEIEVGTKVLNIRKDRFTMDYAIYSHSQQRIAAVGTSEIVTYDYKVGRKVEIPSEYLSLLGV